MEYSEKMLKIDEINQYIEMQQNGEIERLTWQYTYYILLIYEKGCLERLCKAEPEDKNRRRSS